MKGEKRLPVIWEGREFYEIIEFDCHVINLSYKGGGGFFTVLPISPLKYRRKNGTQSEIQIKETHLYTIFSIWDDWGEKKEMQIPNSMLDKIETAKKWAIKNELLVND